ncbi:esterase [Pseudomonas sp. C2B4]|uniref:esterase n=1 Tax=Pseudomonas sp. C2B4 TaxID=2735270 RepID=UPI00158608A5|nr:esterase [Pseudomonas sp. C2B4]NUU39278.1 esterase [Pseudomonas sp. C2B4]
MKLSHGILFILLTYALQGCAPYEQYRTEYSLCRSPQKDCTKSALQWHDPETSAESGYFLGFVEFDDQGDLKDRRQMHAVVDHLYTEAAKKDLLMVVFIHGWHHTARPNDGNIETFQKVLSKIATAETIEAGKAGRPAREVMGIYGGWRGDSLALGPLNVITFWDRKNTASEVGHGDVTELLSRIELVKRTKDSIARRDAATQQLTRIANDAKNKKQSANSVNDEPLTPASVCAEPTKESTTEISSNTKLVVVGHSFGGLVVQSAIGQILEDRAIRTKGGNEGCMADVEGFGNLVVMINPAFEAQQYSTLRNVSSERKSYPPQQLPALLILTSKGDDATGIAFPLGRRFSTVFEKDGWKGENISAVGHYPPYLTHELYKNPSSKTDPNLLSSWAKDAPSNKKLAIAGLILERTKDGSRNPYLNVSVTQDLIEDHNDIGRPEIIEFIKQMILLSTTPDKDRNSINFYTTTPVSVPAPADPVQPKP